MIRFLLVKIPSMERSHNNSLKLLAPSNLRCIRKPFVLPRAIARLRATSNPAQADQLAVVSTLSPLQRIYLRHLNLHFTLQSRQCSCALSVLCPMLYHVILSAPQNLLTAIIIASILYTMETSNQIPTVAVPGKRPGLRYITRLPARCI